MKAGPILAIGGAAILIWALASGGGGGNGNGTCRNLEANTRYEGYYRGARKMLPAIFGDAWYDIYYVEIWYEDEHEWAPPADPTNYYLTPGTLCALRFQAKCRVCNFDWRYAINAINRMAGR